MIEFIKSNTNVFLLIVAILNLVDVSSTGWALFNNYGAEKNPLFSKLFNGNLNYFWIIAFIKSLFSLYLISLIYKHSEDSSFAYCAFALALYYIFIIANNSYQTFLVLKNS